MPNRALLLPLLASLLTLPLAAQETTARKGDPVTAIEVKGNQNTDRAFVLSRMKTKEGRPYDPDVLDEDVKRLYRTRYFNDIETRVAQEAGGVRVTVIVVENQIVVSIVFEGRRRLTPGELHAVLQTSENSWLDPATLLQDIQRLEDLYRDKGYYHVSVEADRKKVADGVEITFRINEGPRVSIRNIEFRGNESLEEKVLRKIMETKESMWILSTAHYDENQLQTDIINLRRYYRDEGFQDVKVDLAEVVLSEDKRKLDIVIVIEEGPRYNVRSVTITGMQLFDEQKVLEAMDLKEGGIMRMEDLINSREMIKKLYGDVGHIFADVAVEMLYAGATPEVDVAFTVTENQSVRVGLVHIRGNTETKDKVIRRDLEIYPNERASLSRLERSVNRLMGRDYYETVDYEFIETEDPELRDCVITVEEKPTGQAQFSMGITSNQGLVGNISITKNNFDFLDLPRSVDDILNGTAFTGAGQYFLIELSPGTEVNRFRVSFQEPYLFDRPISLTLNGFYYVRDREDYEEARTGGSISLGKRLTRDMGVQVAYAIQHILVDELDAAAAEDISLSEGSNFISSVRLSLGIDKRDNPFLTTRGWRAGLSGEMYGGPVGGDFDFFRLGANFSIAFTLMRDQKDRPVIISTGGRTGIMLPFGDSDETPVFERYFGGGPGSIRGFNYRGVSPLQDGDPIGGDAELLSTVELSFPIYADLIRGVIFSDAGSVTRDYGDLFESMRASVGTGVRVSVPFLGPRPLAFDFAIPLATEEGDEEEIFSFSMGRDF